jgi:hypothetical protein
MWRLIHTVTLLAMLGFVGVQYNDPDAWLWALYYGVPAFWAFVAGYRQRLLASMRWRGALWTSVAAWAGLVAHHWPAMPHFWQKAVWIQEESAREGMGLMIALAVLLLALARAYRSA